MRIAYTFEPYYVPLIHGLYYEGTFRSFSRRDATRFVVPRPRFILPYRSDKSFLLCSFRMIGDTCREGIRRQRRGGNVEIPRFVGFPSPVGT